MDLPVAFVNKVRRTFEGGAEWLGRLDDVVGQCAAGWGLRECRPVGGLSYNLVCTAVSPQFGEVVLKVAVPNPEFHTEVRALQLYAGRGVCRCWAVEPHLHAMLLERVLPGADLTTVGDSRRRFLVMADMLRLLPTMPCADESLPRFDDWVERAFARARAEDKAPSALLRMLEPAESALRALSTTATSEVLLHGDLHHWNILSAGSRGWVAIDPKGARGVPCLEAGRFVNNQLEMDGGHKASDDLDQMAAVFAEALGVSPWVIVAAALVDHVMGACWSIEDNAEPASVLHSIDTSALLRDRLAAMAG
jgi:streptomycin 6-kinase